LYAWVADLSGKTFERLLRIKAGLEEESDYQNLAMILGVAHS